ncbi:unnamed protein product [Sphagnum balticum]
MLNGNVSSNGTFYFSGLVTLNAQLGYFEGNLSTVIVPAITDLTDDSTNSAMSNAISDGQAALNSIKLISDGNTGAVETIAYASPISQESLFPTILGTYNSGAVLE